MNEPGTQRIRLTLHYDGAGFFGWQLQPSVRTVQGEIEGVLARLLDRPARVVAAGRTDRGVHATGQVVAVDVPTRWTPPELRRALNALLPPDVWVAEAELASGDFHPRFDAALRVYHYRVGLVPEAASPFHARWCWAPGQRAGGRDLDRDALEAASALLPGTHSFRAFAKAGQEERGDLCTVQEARWVEWNPLGLEFRISANRFLHHMVRYLVGTLIDIGGGVRPVEEMASLLDPTTTLETSPPAPPEGLYLTRVVYPGDSPRGGTPVGSGTPESPSPPEQDL